MAKIKDEPATTHDIRNVEGWAMLVGDVLHKLPYDHQFAILDAARKQIEEDRAFDRAHTKGRVIWYSAAEAEKAFSYRWAYRKACMRLKALTVQRFVRQIKNNNHPNRARALLYAYQPFGHGSKCLEDYLPTAGR